MGNFFTRQRAAVVSALLLAWGYYKRKELMAWMLVKYMISKVGVPAHKFEDKPAPPALDYKKISSWAARPGQDSFAEVVPNCEKKVPNKERLTDCFFVHPTGYFRGDHWNSPIPDEQADEQTLWMLGGSEPVGVTYWKGCFTLLLLVSELAVSRLRSRNREIIYDLSTLPWQLTWTQIIYYEKCKNKILK